MIKELTSLSVDARFLNQFHGGLQNMKKVCALAIPEMQNLPRSLKEP